MVEKVNKGDGGQRQKLNSNKNVDYFKIRGRGVFPKFK